MDDAQLLGAVMIDKKGSSARQPREIEQTFEATIFNAWFCCANINGRDKVICFFCPKDRCIKARSARTDEERKSEPGGIWFRP
jgi:hypothetical protein